MKNFLRLSFMSAMTFLVSIPAFADDGGGSRGMIALGCGLMLGIGALGGGIGQGRAAAAALDGIARNPAASGKIFTPMIIGLALIESLVIYCLVMAYLISGKM